MDLEQTSDVMKDTISLNSAKPSAMLEITISNGCNKHCSYCFEHDQPKTRDLEEEKRQLEIVKRLCNEFDHSRFGRLGLSFWGGEPLMNAEWLHDILKATAPYEFVDYYMFTNGTLHQKLKSLIEDKDTKDAFKCGRFQVQVSYDGEPHHTLKRGYSFDDVVPMLDLLKSNSVGFTMKATVAEDSVALMPECWKSYEKLHEKYGKAISYSPTVDSSSSLDQVDLEFWKRIAEELAKLEFDFIKKNKHPLMQWFRRDQKKICSVKNSIHMHSDGNFYLCHGAPYLDSAKRGKFVIATTKDVLAAADMQSVLFRDDNVDLAQRPLECLKCEATACAMCHVGICDPDNYKDTWASCVCQQKTRCKLYKEFGKIARALNFAVLRDVAERAHSKYR